MGQRLNIIIVAEGAVDNEGKAITPNSVKDVSALTSDCKEISFQDTPSRKSCQICQPIWLDMIEFPFDLKVPEGLNDTQDFYCLYSYLTKDLDNLHN